MSDTRLPEWISAIAGALTTIIAAPAAIAFLIDRRTAQRGRISLSVSQVAGAAHYLAVEYVSPVALEALSARVEVLSGSARLAANGNEIWNYTNGRMEMRPDFVGSTHVQVQLRPHHQDTSLHSATVVVVGLAGASTKLKVTVSTWPTAKRLTQQKRTISAHA